MADGRLPADFVRTWVSHFLSFDLSLVASRAGRLRQTSDEASPLVFFYKRTTGDIDLINEKISSCLAWVVLTAT
jgi:hypothetical protein